MAVGLCRVRGDARGVFACRRERHARPRPSASGRWATRATWSPRCCRTSNARIPASGATAAAARHGRAREAAHRVRRRFACRTSRRSATPGFPSSPRSMRSSRWIAWIARTPGIVAADYFPGAWDTGVIDGKTLRRSLVRRNAPAVLSQGHRRRRRRENDAARLGGMARRDGARSSSRSGRIATRSCCRSTSSSRCSISRCSSPIRCCAMAAGAGISAAPASSARCRSTRTCSTKASRRAWTTRASRMCGRNSEAATSVLRQRALEHRGVPQALAGGRRGIAGARCRCPGRTGRAHRWPAARASCCSRSRRTRKRRGS